MSRSGEGPFQAEGRADTQTAGGKRQQDRGKSEGPSE